MEEYFGFGHALAMLKEGKSVARKGWKWQSISLQAPDFPNRDPKKPSSYIYLRTAQDDLIPWTASQDDILTIDWMIICPTIGGQQSGPIK